MSNQTSAVAPAADIHPVITKQQLLEAWQGHRRLTRRVIGAFPEPELFRFSIGGMRPFADIVMELIGIAGPGAAGMATNEWHPLNEHREHGNSKERILAMWDEATERINQHWAEIPDFRFQETVVAFGRYEGPAYSSILYFIDNEIHHRGQAYVYLRALGNQPPFFWER